MELQEPSESVRVGARLWNEIMAATESSRYFDQRNSRDTTAMNAVLFLLRRAEHERLAARKRMAILRLPTDVRRLYWLRRFVRFCIIRNGRVRRAAAKLIDRIHLRALPVPYVRALHKRWLDASLETDRRALSLRLCNLGYLVSPRTGELYPDPEGCALVLQRRLHRAAQGGWLSGHLSAQLAAERAYRLPEWAPETQ
jgi:hypothetical protein